MKQFFKQLVAGVVAIFAVVLMAVLLWGISALVLKVTAWINIETIIQNVHWIVLGMVLLILVQALGALVLNFFVPSAKNRKREKNKNYETGRRDVARHEVLPEATEEYIEEEASEYYAETEEYVTE